MSSPLKREIFEKLLHTKFNIKFDEQHSYEVELIQVIKGEEIPSLQIEPFSLLFKGNPNEKIFAQNTYTISSPQTDSLSLFLVPTQPDKSGIYYEACIN